MTHRNGGNATGIPGGAPRRSAARGWLQLGAWLGGLVLFVYVLAPLGQRWEPWGTLCRFIAARDIDANAYYWTENEEFITANALLRNKMTYQVDGFTEEPGY